MYRSSALKYSCPRYVPITDRQLLGRYSNQPSEQCIRAGYCTILERGKTKKAILVFLSVSAHHLVASLCPCVIAQYNTHENFAGTGNDKLLSSNPIRYKTGMDKQFSNKPEATRARRHVAGVKTDLKEIKADLAEVKRAVQELAAAKQQQPQTSHERER